MKRFAQATLKNWFDKSDRKPMVIRGARQVGKSTLVRLFCEENKLELIEVNLEKTKIKAVDADDFRIAAVLEEIQLRYKKKIGKHSIIFLDEIQEQPKMLKMLRYFYEDCPDCAVIAAGSLLEVAFNSENFSFPVGRVEFLYLGPMTFFEFLIASDRRDLRDEILSLNFSPAVVSIAQEAFKNFLYIGGMPQAVSAFLRTGSMLEVRPVQEQILQAYRADFPKYNSKVNFNRIQRIFLQGATQVGKKVIYQKFDSESQSRDIRRVVELLIDAKVFLPCFHSDGNSSPLLGEVDHNVYKIYFLDVGLMNCLMQVEFDHLDAEFRSQFKTKGAMTEQFVAQHLYYAKGIQLEPQLYYWLRDKGTQKAEVDFLIENRGTITPIEVKALASGHLKSLLYFVQTKKTKLALKLALCPFKREVITSKGHGIAAGSTLVHLPIWAVEAIGAIFEKDRV
jgi:predicted AAA+ superfamily ATPase